MDRAVAIGGGTAHQGGHWEGEAFSLAALTPLLS